MSLLQVSIPILQPVIYQARNEEPQSSPMNVSFQNRFSMLYTYYDILVHIQEYGLRIEEVAWFCYSTSRAPVASAWVFITSTYLALLQVVGVVLAICTRKVKVKTLKNSKYIIAAIYISAIALLVILVSTFALGNRRNFIELLFSGSLMVSTYVGLTMVFIPKVYNYTNTFIGLSMYRYFVEQSAVKIFPMQIYILIPYSRKFLRDNCFAVCTKNGLAK